MATQNINIDQNQDTNVDITDAASLAADKILMQFYQNDINIFNLATVNMGGEAGEITIVAGVKYVAAVTDKKALLLNPADTLTHRVFKFDTAGIPTEIHLGSVTNEPLSGSSPSQSPLAYSNDRMYQRFITDDFTLTKDDQVVFCTPPDSTDIGISLMDAIQIPGKEYTIKNIAAGSGTVTIVILPGSLVLTAGEIAWIRSKAIVEEPAYPDYVILYTDGVLT